MTVNNDYNEIYNEHKNLVLKAAYLYSGNYHVAEDITQNTFMKLYIYFDDMKKEHIKSWLFNTAKHEAINYVKKAAREICTKNSDLELYMTEIVGSTEEELLKRYRNIENMELHDRIMIALMEKNRRWYDAMVLAYYMEVPQKVVAEKMGIKIEVLHSILHRAKGWIKKQFAVEYEDVDRI